MFYRNLPAMIITIAVFTGYFISTVSGEQVDQTGQDRLSAVSTALSDALDEVDANLTLTAGAFSATDGNNINQNVIVKPYRIPNPGWAGVILLVGETVVPDLNQSVMNGPFNPVLLKDPAVVNSLTSIKPTMSSGMIMGDATRGVLISRPAVVDDDIGAAVAVIIPDQFCNEIISPVLAEADSMCLIMQTDGTILYTTHPVELDHIPPEHILTEFPTFRDVKTAMLTQKTGHLIYEFWHGSPDEPRARDAYWETISLHGTEWRVLIADAIR